MTQTSNQTCIPPQNYVPCQPWPFPYNPNPYMPVAPQKPMYQPTYEWHPDTVPQQFPRNPFMPPQQPMAVNKRFITNENEEFIIDPTNTKLNAFSYEVTDNYICSIDFDDDVRIETNASSYQHVDLLPLPHISEKMVLFFSLYGIHMLGMIA